MADVGGRLGQAIANLITENMMKARSVMMDVEADHADRTRNALWEQLEIELADKLKEIGVNPSADVDLSDEVRNVFASIEQPAHQVDFIFNIVALIGVALTGAFAAAAGYNQQLTQRGMHKSAFVVPDAQQLAAMTNSGVIDVGQAAEWASWTGVQGPVFAHLLEGAFRELAPSEAADLLRRHLISDEQFNLSLERQGLRDWAVGAIRRGIVGPPDAGTIIQAVTQSQLSPAVAQEMLAQIGIDPGNFQWMFLTAGQSPPVDLTLNLWNRGLISDAIVDKIILESPIKNEYVDVIKKMRYHWPPMEQTISMVRRGSYTPEQGADRLAKLGFFPDDIKAMIDWATQDKNQATKDLSSAQIVDLYELQLRDRDATLASLVGIGWSQDEAEWLLSISDVRVMRRNLDKSVSRIRSAYLAHRIDETAASTALDTVGVPSAARDDLLDTWDTERSVNVAVLTQAQLIAAAKKGVITAETCGQRIVQLGYTPEDATILMATAGVVELTKETTSA